MSAFILLYSKQNPNCMNIITKLSNNESLLKIRCICIDNSDIYTLIVQSLLIKVRYIPFLIEINEEGKIICLEGELQCLLKIFPQNNGSKIIKEEMPILSVSQPIIQEEDEVIKPKSIAEKAAMIQQQRGGI
jgi:hypothetical protein